MTKKLLVTSALPYANGSIHLGHLVEYIQTDVWVRVQKMLGNHCYFVCADDAHGTPIMLKAQELGITPEQLIKDISAEHQSDFSEFFIEFDNYHSTHSDENRTISADIYSKLKDSGFIKTRTINQSYDAEKSMFLPDRFIKGTCPKCNTEDQYGDNCEACGATYSPSDLKNPVSVISGATPIKKDTDHLFFDLPKFTKPLKSWLDEGHLQSEVSKKLTEWFETGLKQWDISRDKPYFGFEIPNTTDKYFYVWLDAPIGYMASFQNLCDKIGLDFNEFWNKDSDTQLIHFIGKDIIYFHGLFWPAILKGSGYRTPTSIFAHGFLTVNGEKMSKSRGTFIKARTYLDNLDPEALRYYFCAKLSDGIDDIDLNLADFKQRVNSDLVGKVINIASRCAGFIHKNHGGILAENLTEIDLYQKFIDAKDEISELFIKRKTSQAIRKIMSLADMANQYIDQQKPWILVKEQGQELAVQNVCSVGLNLFRVLMTYLSPIIPKMAENSAHFLNCELSFSAIKKPLINHKINQFKPLMQRIDDTDIEKMLDQSRKNEKSPKNDEKPKNNNMIDFNDFAKVDLVVAKIIKAEQVEGADKLLKIELDIGENQKKQVFSGIKHSYRCEDLLGKYTVLVNNLAPRKMRFGVSEGMILTASGKDKIFLLSLDDGVKSGMKIS